MDDSPSAYRRGDTELDRNVEITDFNSLVSNFDPTGNNEFVGNWQNDNFDITDFNHLVTYFAPTRHRVENHVPEPSSLFLRVFASLAILVIRLSMGAGNGFSGGKKRIG